MGPVSYFCRNVPGSIPACAPLGPNDQWIVERVADAWQGRAGIVRLRLDELLRNVASDLNRLLDRPPLGHESLDFIARREIDAFGQSFDVQLSHVFHGFIYRAAPDIIRSRS